jgi:sugar phosphate isomerase/epimerase
LVLAFGAPRAEEMVLTQTSQTKSAEAPELHLGLAPFVPYREPLAAPLAMSLLDAAACAGFSGVSTPVALHDSMVADGCTTDDFVEYHRSRGLTIVFTEALTDWTSPGIAGAAKSNLHRLDVTAKMGAPGIVAFAMAKSMPSLRAASAELARLCDVASERGLRVSLEFLPFACISNLADALVLLDAVDRDNLGLVIDAWHWQRQPGGPDLATLRQVPPERIHVLQLNDATGAPLDDLLVETATARLLPGDGVVDLVGLIDVLAEMHANPVIMSEVFSSELAALGQAEFSRRQYDALRAFLDRHRSDSG